MKSLSLFTSVVSLLFVTWVFSLWMDPERLCMDSPLVSGLQVEASTGNVFEVPKCFLLSRLVQPKLDPENQILLKGMIHRVNQLETAVMILPTGWRPVALKVSFHDPFTLKTDFDQLSFGAEFLRSKGLLEKVILQEVLQSVYETPDRYALELVSDFLTTVALNSWVYGETQPVSASFLSHVVSFREYCFSSLKSIFHWDYCTNQNSLLDVADSAPGLKDVTIWGVRNFLAHHLWRHYQKLDLQRKNTFLYLVRENLEKNDFKYPKEILTLKELAAWASGYLNELAALDLNPDSFLNVSMIVDLREVPGEALTSIPSAKDPFFKKHAIDEVLLHHRHGITHLPTFRKLSLGLHEVRARYLIVPTCRGYSFSELARYQAERVVVIQGCSAVEWNWPELLKRDLMGYLKGSQKHFAIFHTNSLRFALKQGVVKGSEMFQLDSPEEMKEKYAWEALFWKKSFLAYRPLSDINMITLIR